MKILLYILVLFTFLKPSGFDALGYSAINSLFNTLRICLAVIILFLYLRKNRISRNLCYELLFFIPLGVSSFLNNSGIERYFIFAGSVLSLTMCIEIMIKKDVKAFIYSLFYTYFLLIVTNYVYMISVGGVFIDIENARPDLFVFNSESVVTLLSSVNGVASYIFPAIFSSVLLMRITTFKNLMCWGLILLCFLSELFLWSATSLSGVFILVIYILFIFNNMRISRKYVRPNLILLGTLFLSLGITFFNIQNWFSYIITEILHKDLTMTGRTNVWEVGFKGFRESPIWGCGFGSQTIDNCYIQVLYATGIVGAIGFFLYIYYSVKKMHLNNPIRLERFVGILFAVEVLMFTTESWINFLGLFITLILGVNLREIESRLLIRPS